MNLTEFLLTLREATNANQLRWNVNEIGIIRTSSVPDNERCCPITAVYKHKFNEFIPIGETTKASIYLGLDEDLAASIAWAADDYESLPPLVHAIRQGLLKIVQTPKE